MNEGLKAWCTQLALREMAVHGCDEWWVGDELVTRFECERQLGIGEGDV